MPNANCFSLWTCGMHHHWGWMHSCTIYGQRSCFMFFSPTLLIAQLLEWVQEEWLRVILITPELISKLVVPGPTTADRPAIETVVAIGCSLTGRRSDQELPSNRLEPLGTAAEWEDLERMGLSQDVVCTIQGTHAASTTACYTSKRIAFQWWWLEKDIDPISCTLSCISYILQLLMDKNLSFNMVKIYAAAISSCHEGFNKRMGFNHPLMKHFLKGLHRHKPVSHAIIHQWDVMFILCTLTRELFEPLDQYHWSSCLS